VEKQSDEVKQPDETRQPDEARQPKEARPAEVGPPVTPARTEPIDVIYGIFARPDETLKALAERPRPWLGLLSYALVTLVSGSQSVLQMRQAGVAATRGLGGIILMTTIAGLVAWFVAIGIMNLAAEVLGHKGSGLGLITVLGVAVIPAALIVPLRVGSRLMGLGFLSGLGGLAIGIWIIVLQVKAIKHNYQVSTGKAFAIFVAPFALILAVVIGFVFSFGVLLLNSPLLRGLPRLPGLP